MQDNSMLNMLLRYHFYSLGIVVLTPVQTSGLSAFDQVRFVVLLFQIDDNRPKHGNPILFRDIFKTR